LRPDKITAHHKRQSQQNQSNKFHLLPFRLFHTFPSGSFRAFESTGNPPALLGLEFDHLASLIGRSSDDLMMVHRTNPGRLRILRHTFSSGLESTFDLFHKHPEPDMKWQKLPFSAVGALPCPEMAGPMHFVDALRGITMAKPESTTVWYQLLLT
jgi:hypothetical protein